MDCFAVVPQGLEEEAVKELTLLGARAIRPLKRSVSFKSDLRSFYRINLQARLPFRVLRKINDFSCDSPSSLYHNIQKAFDWESWLHPSKSFRVNVTGSTFGLTHSHFSALQVKNALVDLQRQIWGIRSRISLDQPDLCIHLHLCNGNAVLSFDSASSSFHRRGYRPIMSLAPLKENLAAGLINMTNWDYSKPIVDPLCGSGTFLLEAASISLRSPIGLNRKFILQNWLDFDNQIWDSEVQTIRQSFIHNRQLPILIGSEKNQEIAEYANQNIRNNSFNQYIKIKNIHFRDLQLPKQEGLIICNPPYGKRLGDEKELVELYTELGNYLKDNASGWDLWLLSGNPNLTKFLKMKCKRRYPVSNGGIDCRWLHYKIN